MTDQPIKRGPGRPRKSTPKETLSGTTVMDADDFTDPLDDEIDGDVVKAPTTDEAPITHGQLAQTTNELAKAVKVLADSQPVKRVPWAKFKTRSPFNPTGNRRRKLNRRFYQNGRRMNVKLLHDEEISLLNALKPGQFIGNRVSVIEIVNGGNIDVNLVYKNKGIDQQLDNKSHWRNLTELLQKCVTEAVQNEAVEAETHKRVNRVR